ncbi:flagellar hook-length control protein FliK [Hydrogenophaga sp.]|uniref:flagellar hook-length control protein FliK n=1 Tax=Hydrogenophaga sp. TaxID=1904254 RepID=UPI00262DA75C|nr:flagellar hook-length control protein FliK [Hydrogenophaga sp.]
MSTTSATASAPKPVEANAKPTPPGARAQDRKAEGGDLFAALLGLLSATQALPAAATATTTGTEPADDAKGDHSTPDGSDNPLTALMGWGLPSAADAALGKSSAKGGDDNVGLPGAAWSAERAARSTASAGSADGGFDISGMTPVEPTPLEPAPKGPMALPAHAARLGLQPLPTARPTDTLTNGAPATAWRHASLASTETVAIQQAANLPSVRSTVALNERFGVAPGVPLATTELREATTDTFSVSSPTASSRSADGTAAPAGASAGDGATGSDGQGSDASAFDHTDGQAGNPFADAQAAEEPTVTHWGTQHLRHASLRVDGESGEQAIDIQLSMQGQEVQVAFKTDSAEARASLRENAGESLADLLGKSGIQLGGVSVGSQGQPGSRGDDGGARQNGVRGVASVARESLAPSNRPVQPAPRADGSQPLDVFA